MHRRPGETSCLCCFRVEMQGIVVAGNGRITRERILRERPEVLGADLIAGPWPVQRRRPWCGVDHMSVSATSRTIRKTVSRRAQISPSAVETTIFKIRRGGFSLASISTSRT